MKRQRNSLKKEAKEEIERMKIRKLSMGNRWGTIADVSRG
jgi:hypothetical protein